MEKNPISELQEICFAKNWPLPAYKLVGENGPAHSKNFLMEVSVKGNTSFGSGQTKKAAKTISAINALVHLKQESTSNAVPATIEKDINSVTCVHESVIEIGHQRSMNEINELRHQLQEMNATLQTTVLEMIEDYESEYGYGSTLLNDEWPIETDKSIQPVETIIEVTRNDKLTVSTLDVLKSTALTVKGLNDIIGESMICPVSNRDEPCWFKLNVNVSGEKYRIDGFGKDLIEAEKRALAKFIEMNYEEK